MGTYVCRLISLEQCITLASNVEHSLDLLDSLAFDQMSAREEQLEIANEPTLEWIWSLPKGLKSLTDWLSNSIGTFWIQGKAGSGKSTLMNHINGHDKTRLLLRQCHPEPWSIVRFFFDFRAHIGIPNSFDGLLRALLFQLVAEIPRLSHFIRQFAAVDHLTLQAPAELRWTTPKLRQAFLSMLKECSQNICMFIDGLDELEGTSRDMLELVEFLQEVGRLESESHSIKLCFASRPDPLITTVLGASWGLKLQDYNEHGVVQYVSNRLEVAADRFDALPYPSSKSSQFATTITKRSCGVFLWARFAVEELLQGTAEGDELHELWARVAALPQDLEDIYRRIVDRLMSKGGDPQETAIILQMAYFQARAASLQDLFIVFQLSMGRNTIIDDQSLSQFRMRLLAKTGGLVEIVPGAKDEVKLIHETVRSFLHRPNIMFAKTTEVASSYAVAVRPWVRYELHLFPQETRVARAMPWTPNPSDIVYFTPAKLSPSAYIDQYDENVEARGHFGSCIQCYLDGKTVSCQTTVYLY